MRVALIGAGRAGGALAAALAAAGAEVALWDRDPARTRRTARAAGVCGCARLGDALDRARIALFAVGDDALPAAARAAARAWPARGPAVALHTAGAHGAATLDPLAACGVATGVFHPAVALEGPRSAGRLAGRIATVSGAPRALAAGRALARRLEMRALAVSDGDRPFVHLAASMSAGGVAALLHLAEAVARRGLAPRDARRLVAALAADALDGIARRGAARSITGPAARGDLATLARHAAAARAAGPDVAAAYAALGPAAARAAGQPPAAVRRVARALAPR